jgi:hypothetical protein
LTFDFDAFAHDELFKRRERRGHREIRKVSYPLRSLRPLRFS